MEDAATAEISRTQVWQWLRHGARTDDGATVDEALVRGTLAGVASELAAQDFPGAERLGRARELLERLVFADALDEFLTTIAYDEL